MLGRGKTLFGEGAKSAGFRLLSHDVTAMGVITARYARAGAAETGDYGTEPPNAAEAVCG